MVTIALKRVENPLEFGVVVVDEEGRIERFLEKPTWGQVFCDTVNTGIYVLEPEVFDHIPADSPYDFSQDLFPKLFEMGAPLYGYVAEGYWQDIGSLRPVPGRQPRRARRQGPGHHARHPSATTASSSARHSTSTRSTTSRGRRSSATTPRSTPTARIGPYSVLGSNVVVKGHAETRNCVIDANTYIGSSAKVLRRHHRQELRRQGRRHA